MRFAMCVVAVLLSVSSPLAAQGNRILVEETIAKEFVRGFLPQDGEVLTHVLKRDVWPQNTDPFERHETVEISFGKAIRAQKGHRRNEATMSPGVQFKEGGFLLQGGWRAHKQVAVHNDYFDGTFVIQAVPVIVGERTYIQSTVSMTWRRSFLGRLPGIGDAITRAVLTRANRAVEKAIREDLPRQIDEQARKALTQAGVDPSLRGHVVVDVVEGGLRVRVLEKKVEAVRVGVGTIDYKPPHRPPGDREFDGNGPHVRITAEVKHAGREVRAFVDMEARETKRDWTEASGDTSKLMYTAPEGRSILALVGATRWDPLVDGETDGHDATEVDTLLGRLTIWGDRRGNDAGDYTRMLLAGDYEVTVLLD
jgi:hypothetical protein